MPMQSSGSYRGSALAQVTQSPGESCKVKNLNTYLQQRPRSETQALFRITKRILGQALRTSKGQEGGVLRKRVDTGRWLQAHQTREGGQGPAF